MDSSSIGNVVTNASWPHLNGKVRGKLRFYNFFEHNCHSKLFINYKHRLLSDGPTVQFYLSKDFSTGNAIFEEDY